MTSPLIFGLDTGTFPQWGMFVSLLGIIAGGITVFIKGIPQRVKANSDARHADHADYASQIKEFRDEVHGYRNELHLVLNRLSLSESTSRRRGDRIKNMLFVLRLVMGELRKHDPKNSILEQAETMLSQMDEGEESDIGSIKSNPLRAAEDTMHAAKSTLHTAERTVSEVKATEAVKLPRAARTRG